MELLHENLEENEPTKVEGDDRESTVARSVNQTKGETLILYVVGCVELYTRAIAWPEHTLN